MIWSKPPKMLAMSSGLFALVLAACPLASAHEAPAPGAMAASPYQPFLPLIGDWDVGPAGAPPVVLLRFGWGPGQSYLTFSATEGATTHLHFDGVLMWNGADHDLDMLVMLDVSPGASIQEQGAMKALPDGSFERDIIAVYSAGARLPGGGVASADGARVRYRQTFTPDGPNRMLTNALRQTPDGGWAPTFPGSDHLVMVRHA